MAPRLEIGLGFACSDCWEADFNWTHYQSKARISDFRGVDTKWKVQVDMYDLEIGKEMWFRRAFRLKPYIGLRFAEIRQRWRFNVEGNFQSIFMMPFIFPTPNTTNFVLLGNYRHNYLAGGPRIGFDASWCVGCGFNFYITGAANYLYGEMQNRYGDNYVVEGIDKDHHWEGTGITDFTCGIGWSDLWWNQRRRINMRFGYEHHFFIHENKLDTLGGIKMNKQRNWFVQGIGGTISVDF